MNNQIDKLKNFIILEKVFKLKKVREFHYKNIEKSKKSPH